MSGFISVVHGNDVDSCDQWADNTATDHVTSSVSDNNGNNHQMLGTSVMYAMCGVSAVCVWFMYIFFTYLLQLFYILKQIFNDRTLII